VAMAPLVCPCVTPPSPLSIPYESCGSVVDDPHSPFPSPFVSEIGSNHLWRPDQSSILGLGRQTPIQMPFQLISSSFASHRITLHISQTCMDGMDGAREGFMSISASGGRGAAAIIFLGLVITAVEVSLDCRTHCHTLSLAQRRKREKILNADLFFCSHQS